MATIYNRSAQKHDQHRNPVIVIPGIIGSRLLDQESGKLVWGAFTSEAANPERAAEARVVGLPMRVGAKLSELTDQVRPDGALARLKVRILGLPIKLSAYVQLLATLGVGGFRDEDLGRSGSVDYGGEHYTCFQFDYDWRRDNVENARNLHEFIETKRAYVKRETKRRFGVERREVKFDIVAHSMGALIARYYLRYGASDLPADGSAPKITWAGARNIERVIMVGPPNAGSAFAMIRLQRGFKFGPVVPHYPPALLGTMPSLYQLLPRSRHNRVVQGKDSTKPVGDLLDSELWKRMHWGLADPKQDKYLKGLLPGVKTATERRRVALDHLEKCLRRARRLAAALDVPAAPPENVKLHLFAGDAVFTPDVLSYDSKKEQLKVIKRSPGDGTVTRASALMDERVGGKWRRNLLSPIRWSAVHFLFTNHLGMTRDPAFTDNVLHILLESRQGLGAKKK